MFARLFARKMQSPDDGVITSAKSVLKKINKAIDEKLKKETAPSETLPYSVLSAGLAVGFTAATCVFAYYVVQSIGSDYILKSNYKMLEFSYNAQQVNCSDAFCASYRNNVFHCNPVTKSDLSCMQQFYPECSTTLWPDYTTLCAQINSLKTNFILPIMTSLGGLILCGVGSLKAHERSNKPRDNLLTRTFAELSAIELHNENPDFRVKFMEWQKQDASIREVLHKIELFIENPYADNKITIVFKR